MKNNSVGENLSCKRLTWLWPLASCALVLSFGCVDDGPQPPGLSATPIVGGTIESGYPLVGALAVEIPGHGTEAFCSATAVTPTVLLTAAHCLDAFEELFGYTIVFHQTFEDGSEAVTTIEDESYVNHPEWTGHIGPGAYADIGLARLAESIEGDVFPLLHDSELSAGDIGTRLLAVGFGITETDAEDSGIKRSVEIEVTRVLARSFAIEGYPDQWSGICNGDSGGPTFYVEDDRDVQWGVHVRGTAWECGPAEETSVGAFLDDFLTDTILSLDPAAAECGDGFCTGIEEQDDCLVDCAELECGDGLQVPPEVCDDENTEDGDGCSADCSSDESCGNDIVDIAAGEICDDGNVNGDDGCSADCTSDESCGNDIIDTSTGEICDDGNSESGDGCSADCTSDESCGNGVLDEATGEVCDDGNDIDDDECTSDCTLPEEDDAYEAGGGGSCDCIAAPGRGKISMIQLLLELLD